MSHNFLALKGNVAILMDIVIWKGNLCDKILRTNIDQNLGENTC